MDAVDPELMYISLADVYCISRRIEASGMQSLRHVNRTLAFFEESLHLALKRLGHYSFQMED